MNSNTLLQIGADKAAVTMAHGQGGPFGAVITYKGKVIAVSSNSVLASHDPTAHAEVNAIREAGRVLGTHDLSGCEIYATGAPCPMCMSAIIWSNMKKVYISGKYEQAERIGFRDRFIYDFIKGECKDKKVLDMEYCDSSIAEELYKEYEQGGEIY